MNGKKLALAQLLSKSRLDKICLSRSRENLMIFNFHRIRPDGPIFLTEFDDEVFGPKASELRNYLMWLKANTNIISESKLLNFIRAKETLPSRSTMITFDDGYIDQYTLALPILKELGIPATFFIPTDAIEYRHLGWWDLIAYILKRTTRSDIILNGETCSLLERKALCTRFLETMKLAKSHDTADFVTDLAKACDVNLPGVDIMTRELMTWEQIREAAANGVTIGSHTHSHRVLATLSLDSQYQELKISKELLESKLNFQIRSISYPVGGYEHINIETRRLVKDCGYEAAFSFTNEINNLNLFEPFCIKRLMTPDHLALISASVALPFIFVRRRCAYKQSIHSSDFSNEQIRHQDLKVSVCPSGATNQAL